MTMARSDRSHKSTGGARDQRVLDLYDRVLEIEQRLIPTGLHIFGKVPEIAEIESLLQMVASFERINPETNQNVQALTDLVASGLGLDYYAELLAKSAHDAQRLSERERVEDLVREAVKSFVSTGGERAIRFLEERANVARADSQAVFALLARIKGQLEVNTELDALMRAIRGEYIEPGPGAD